MSASNSNDELLSLAAGIVSAHVSHNGVPADGLPDLILSVYAALTNAGMPAPVEATREPAVPVKKSIFPDYLVCLEDGKKMKMLKRYLLRSYGLTPEAYRSRWRLPCSYPMVAPNYASRRSELAVSIGLGRKLEPQVASIDAPVQDIPAGGRRGKKATASA